MCGTTRRTGPTRRGSGTRWWEPWSTRSRATAPCSPTPGSNRNIATTVSPPRCPRVPSTTSGPRTARSPCSARSRPSSSRPTRSTPTWLTPTTPAAPATSEPRPPRPSSGQALAEPRPSLARRLRQPGGDTVQDQLDVAHDLFFLAGVLGAEDEVHHPRVTAALDHLLDERRALVHDLF